MFRSALLILSGNAAASLLLLARNLIIARLIPVADYGIASTFAIAMAVVEMMSQLGLQQQIVQAKDGENPRFQAALQGFQVLRGAIASVALYFLAGALANFLNIPQAAWAYQVLAAVPLLTALTHFDVHRLNRKMVFWPVVLTGAVPALVSLVVVLPLTLLFGDYRVMLYAIILQAILTAVTSHLVSERPYQLILDRKVMAQSLRFGWPLLVNGMLLFAVFNGDKMLVGRELGMETLAIFAMGFTLTLTPTLVMARSVQNFFLPQLSTAQHNRARNEKRFHHLSMVTFQISLITGIVLILSIAFFGELVVHILLGADYAALGSLLVPMAVMQAIRVAKTGSSVVALACERTANAMLANIVRVATLPIIWVALHYGANLYVIILIATLGEIAGYALSLWLVWRTVELPLNNLFWPVLISAALFAIATIGMLLPEKLMMYLLIGLSLVAFASMRDLLRYVFGGHDNGAQTSSAL